MFLAIAITAIVAGAAVYFLHPSYFTVKNIKAEVDKVETELSTELAKVEAAGKAGLTAAQAEAKAVIARIKALF